jgi:hypothetical protein
MNKIKEYFEKKQKEKEMKYLYEMVYNFDDLCERYPGLKHLMRPIALRIWLDDYDEEEKKDFCIALIRSMGYEVREEEK